jgi:hypothetical protein
MRKMAVLIGLAVGLAACGQSADNGGTNQAAAKTAKPKKERPPYCFFKSSETKDWAASRDKDGNIVVHGKAYREDSRYQAQIGKMDVSGTTATVWPTVAPNMTGYGAPENWWDVKATIPNSRTIQNVSVHCGEKTLAELKVAQPK